VVRSHHASQSTSLVRPWWSSCPVSRPSCVRFAPPARGIEAPEVLDRAIVARRTAIASPSTRWHRGAMKPSTSTSFRTIRVVRLVAGSWFFTPGTRVRFPHDALEVRVVHPNEHTRKRTTNPSSTGFGLRRQTLAPLGRLDPRPCPHRPDGSSRRPLMPESPVRVRVGTPRVTRRERVW
jgi:hypothetical protein